LVAASAALGALVVRLNNPSFANRYPMKPFLPRIVCAGCGLLALAHVVVSGAPAAPSPRLVADWDADWRFARGNPATAMAPGFDDQAWRRVRVPHDWSTEEPFRADHGSGNGYAAGGIGWYRKHFTLDPAWQRRAITVEFDGVYANSEVWLNGQFVGGRPYGYSSFALDLTPYLRFGADDNVLAVRVDHSRFADSRWYTGSGIYRHVRPSRTGAPSSRHQRSAPMPRRCGSKRRCKTIQAAPVVFRSKETSWMPAAKWSRRRAGGAQRTPMQRRPWS
jgi:hypothetical protein